MALAASDLVPSAATVRLVLAYCLRHTVDGTDALKPGNGARAGLQTRLDCVA